MDYAEMSNLGDRKVNEDSVGIFTCGDRQVFLVADGLGGHGLGDVASALAVKGADEICQEPVGTMEERINKFFLWTQNQIHEEQRKQNTTSKLRTTAVLLIVQDGKMQWAHIGDSRLYLFRHNRIVAQTKDHSVVQRMVDWHEIKKADMRHHPDRNRLLSVLGERDECLNYTLGKPIPLRKAQAVLLCTDGFWEWVDEKEMCSWLKRSKSAQEWLECLEQRLLENAGEQEKDNFSAIAIRF